MARRYSLAFLCISALVTLHWGGVLSSMIIPLHFSTPNNSLLLRADFHDGYSRRHLQNSKLPSANMRLYDDLLYHGYYTTRLYIGTPPQEFALIVDTGSSVTYVPCSGCRQCGKHQDPRFQPESSSSHQYVNCNPSCNCDDEGKLCIYERRYAEKSTSSGVLSEDIVSFGTESELAPQRFVFGCENLETGDLYHQRADGIIGLGSDRLSIVDQLVENHVISDSFSLCYGGMDVGGGGMVLGSIAPPQDMVFTHSDPFRSPYYNIDLKEIHIAGKPLKLNPKVFDGSHGTVMDSGTTYAYFPEEAFHAIKDAIVKETKSLKRIHGPDPSFHDMCFVGAGREVSGLSKVFPQLDMVFGKGQKLTLSPENYLFRHTRVSGAYCLGIFQNENDGSTLLGGIIVRNMLVTYDRENDQIGFWKTNCSELSKRLQIPGVPAPPPVVPPNSNTSGIVPPTQSPVGLPPDFLPGDFHIGIITFEMLISVNNSSIKPNLTEVAIFIAHELEVHNSQVHMLNFTLNGDNYLVRWGIFPAESGDYFSKNTAMDIIVRLREHRVQLPERIGSYQLIEWNVEPQRNKTWWQLHFLGVVVGIVLSLVVSLLGIGVWLVRRRRRQTFVGTYEPVGASFPEQELQPVQA
ncbi:hypothetical protein K2173_028416 [Erythroxylum novogranatense]|uniref:Peptidase A1 domain-containing protein n=1 Tax=Erythroxylum novogranatense TaxID=1862640 RepID=A0AAV8U4V3_9ROSI|nr:hypothetical protein K2173_028416 [Erythroxylum novogranatense]